MYVCICNDVKEKQIRAALASGIDTLDGLKETLDVATCCGCCEPMVNDYLEAHHAKLDMLAYAVQMVQMSCHEYANLFSLVLT